MKLALVVKNRDEFSFLDSMKIYDQPLSVDYFKNPIKAYDLLSDNDYDAVIIDVSIYPRHWSMIVQAFNQRAKEIRKPAVLLYRNRDELDFYKAGYLGVNAFIKKDENGTVSAELIENILNTFPLALRNSLGGPDESVILAFIHPREDTLIEGLILRVEEDVIDILPDMPHLTLSLEEGCELLSCYIKKDDTILQCRGSVVYNNSVMRIKLENFSFEGSGLLHYITDYKEIVHEHHEVSGNQSSQ